MSVNYGEYKGVKVSIDDGGWFEATIDGANIRENTYRVLQEKIDQTLKNKAKAKKKVLSIKVVNEDLKAATVTGVHARLGTLTMTPKLECRRYGGSSDVWLDCEPVKKLLTEKRAAEQRIKQIENELRVFAIKVEKGGYGELRDMQIETEDGEVIEITCLKEQFGREVIKEHMDREVALFDYGYGITCHKSQGSEFDRVAVLEEVASMWERKRWTYTAATRARDVLLYCS